MSFSVNRFILLLLLGVFWGDKTLSAGSGDLSSLINAFTDLTDAVVDLDSRLDDMDVTTPITDIAGDMNAMSNNMTLPFVASAGVIFFATGWFTWNGLNYLKYICKQKKRSRRTPLQDPLVEDP